MQSRDCDDTRIITVKHFSALARTKIRLEAKGKQWVNILPLFFFHLYLFCLFIILFLIYCASHLSMHRKWWANIWNRTQLCASIMTSLNLIGSQLIMIWMQTVSELTCIVVNNWISMISFKSRWGRVTYICVGKTIIIDSDDGLASCQWQSIILTNAGILFIGPLKQN